MVFFTPIARESERVTFLTLVEAVNQSQQGGLYIRWEGGGLKETGANTECFRQRLKRGAGTMDSVVRQKKGQTHSQ